MNELNILKNVINFIERSLSLFDTIHSISILEKSGKSATVEALATTNMFIQYDYIFTFIVTYDEDLEYIVKLNKAERL